MAQINQISDLSLETIEDGEEKPLTKPKNGKEFRKGFKRTHTNKTTQELLTMSQNRVMITFSDEAGYNFLLNDEKELFRLKSTSYLDMENFEKTGNFQVHLYYKKNRTTTLRSWENKYLDRIKKHVEIDRGDINHKEIMDNSLSKKIREVHNNYLSKVSNKATESKISIHDAPDLSESFPGSKKVKVSQGKDSSLCTRSKPKTKHELSIEISNLAVDVRLKLCQLEEKRRQNVSLRKEISENKQTIENLLNKQTIFVDILQGIMGKLSPDRQSLYQEKLAELKVDSLPKQLQQVTTQINEDTVFPTLGSWPNNGVELKKSEQILEIETGKQAIVSKCGNKSTNEEIIFMSPAENDTSEDVAVEDDNKSSSFLTLRGIDSPKDFNSLKTAQTSVAQHNPQKRPKKLPNSENLKIIEIIKKHMKKNKLTYDGMLKEANILKWKTVLQSYPEQFQDFS